MVTSSKSDQYLERFLYAATIRHILTSPEKDNKKAAGYAQILTVDIQSQLNIKFALVILKGKFPCLDPLPGNGVNVELLLHISAGPQHQRHRKLLQPAFGPSHLRAALDASYESSRKLVKIWSDKPDSERVVDVYRAMTDLTSDIAKIAFSYDFRGAAIEYRAGHGTSANSLTFSFLRLAENPDVCKKLQAEIDSVIGPNVRATTENVGGLV
ncbi:hypothetical protein SmJEL517_g00986 [Synchytrium microbalum]|uniref:Uncharacterized protein n=1 Tax=Synchytrium microbalum TaxID=1806994 RepID=A0A507CC88_9FUNG|nr:uncharacterized protein SmJEL517_g00986 [Synchytrium microbalum]TPX37232.1 hypothetical protein SmJEL517_g00986 [Synchytrium microbalum]